MKKIITYIVVLLLIVAFVLYFILGNKTSGPDGPDGPVNNTPAFQTVVVAPQAHDTSSFTEGFLFYKGFIYESTGEYGKSKLLKIDPASWKIVKEISLDEKYFGEGISILRDTIYQLTYLEHTVFVYDLNFNKIREMYFDTDTHQGWGMTTDGSYLIATDGSSNLQYFDPSTFKLVKRVNVTENGFPLSEINELEWIDGFVYANRWHEARIYKIDPATGNVVAKSDISDIWNQTIQGDNEAVPNGIAYDSSSKKIYITGKRWPRLYEVKFQ